MASLSALHSLSLRVGDLVHRVGHKREAHVFQVVRTGFKANEAGVNADGGRGAGMGSAIITPALSCLAYGKHSVSSSHQYAFHIQSDQQCATSQKQLGQCMYLVHTNADFTLSF